MPTRAVLLREAVTWLAKGSEEENQQQAIALQVALVCCRDSRREGRGQSTGEGHKSRWGCPRGRRSVLSCKGKALSMGELMLKDVSACGWCSR